MRCAALLLLLTACSDDFPAFPGSDAGIRVRDAAALDVASELDTTPRDQDVFDVARPPMQDAFVRPDARIPEEMGPPIDLAVPADAQPRDAAPPPPDAGTDGPRFLYVDAGKEHTCAIRGDRTIVCWGQDSEGRLNAPPGVFEKLTLGEAHACAWGAGTFPVCWGRNDQGSTEPPPFVLYKAIEAGRRTTCGLTVISTVDCWGEDYHGLVSMRPEGFWRDITLTWQHACVADFFPNVECWGDDGNGQLIDDPTGLLVAAGTEHTCVMDLTPRIHCAGMPAEPPPNMALNVQFTALTAGEGHTCGLTDANEIQCWGDNRDGRAMAPPGRFTQVSAGGAHTCALREDGEILCWGKNHRGQIDVPQ